MIDFFIERPLIVNVLTVIIILVGLLSLYTLQKETFPQVDFDVITITTVYPGSSSEDVEKLVTISIERNLKGIDGIKKLNAISLENTSVITLEVEAEADLDDVLDDIKTAVDTVDDLPVDAETPIIKSRNNKQRGVIKIALYGAEYDKLRQSAKVLRDRLELLKPVAQVELDGYDVDEIAIEINPDKLNAFDLTFSEVSTAVADRNFTLSAGKIETPKADIIVRTVAEYRNVLDIEEVIIRSNTDGSQIKVKDIATVTRRPTKDAVLHRSQGERAIFLSVKTKQSANVINSANKIKQKVSDVLSSGKYNDVKYRFTDDMSYYVVRRLDILKNNGIVGLLLVFVCLTMFLNIRTSIVTSLGAPIAFMISFVVMNWFGLSINLISMFALILVLGMLVDDSIIVAEHFYQKIEKGMPPKLAAKQAAYETVKPVIATILTTMVAFGALFFMGGIMGKFLWSVPAVVIVCLLGSLFECFFILPSHLADFCSVSKEKLTEKKSRWYDKMYHYYGKSLKFFLHRPFKVFCSFFLVFLMSLGVAKYTKFELFPGDDVRTVFLTLKGEVGVPLERTNEAVMKIEQSAFKLIRKEELDQVRSAVGLFVAGGHGLKSGSHYGSLILYLTPPNERERSTDDIINMIKKDIAPQVPGYELGINKAEGGPPKGKPVEIELTGGSLKELNVLAKKVQQELRKVKGVTSTELDYEEGKKQFVAKINSYDARRLGLTTKQIAFELRRALSGDSLTEIRESDEDIEVKVMLDEESKSKISSLEKLFIINTQGRRIPLSRVVSFVQGPGAFVIRRLNRKRVISVSGSLDKELTSPLQVVKDFSPTVKKLLLGHPDVDYLFAGENENTKESMQGLLKAGIIAFMAIFFILVAMFGSLGQPVVIMSAIPLGLTGVIFTFFIFGKALGFMAFMGVVGLIGVVVNDSIVLVNFINVKRLETENLFDAIYEASLSRFRAVILTTFTTVAGLLPVAHTPGGDPFIKPMAMSFAWGLLFATAVTLVFIPCNYFVYIKTLEFFSGLSGRLSAKMGRFRSLRGQ